MSRRSALQVFEEYCQFPLRDPREAPRPRRPVRWDESPGSPAAASELVEVVARVDGSIERFWIDARREGGREWARHAAEPCRSAAECDHEGKTYGDAFQGRSGVPCSSGSHDGARLPGPSA